MFLLSISNAASSRIKINDLDAHTDIKNKRGQNKQATKKYNEVMTHLPVCSTSGQH
jgi:hypothetical protein